MVNWTVASERFLSTVGSWLSPKRLEMAMRRRDAGSDDCVVVDVDEAHDEYKGEDLKE